MENCNNERNYGKISVQFIMKKRVKKKITGSKI